VPVGVHEYEAEQLEVEEMLRGWLKGSRNKTERGRRLLSYIRTGRVEVPRLARRVQRRALRQRTPDDLHIYVAPCLPRGINKLGFTRRPAQRYKQLRAFRWGSPLGNGFYSAVWIVQRGNARQIEMWSHAFAHAISPPIPRHDEYHRVQAKLLAEIVLAVAEWLGFTIVQIVPALRLEGRLVGKPMAQPSNGTAD
jgi:hypothetical protein